jgi:hypothetical protein
MRNINLLPAGQEADAAEATEALRKLNDMMLALPAKGVHTGWTEKTIAENFPLEDRHIEGVKWMLTAKLAVTSSFVLSAEQRQSIAEGWAALRADYQMPEALRMDSGLQGMPSQRTYWR